MYCNDEMVQDSCRAVIAKEGRHTSSPNQAIFHRHREDRFTPLAITRSWFMYTLQNFTPISSTLILIRPYNNTVTVV